MQVGTTRWFSKNKYSCKLQ